MGMRIITNRGNIYDEIFYINRDFENNPFEYEKTFYKKSTLSRWLHAYSELWESRGVNIVIKKRKVKTFVNFDDLSNIKINIYDDHEDRRKLVWEVKLRQKNEDK